MVSVVNRRTDAELAFADHVAKYGDPTEAARRAGFTQPSRDASRLMARPGVQAEIARIQTERLFSEVLPLAVEQHLALLHNKATPAGARVQAIKLAYDRTLGGDGAAPTKEPHEMTAEEIAEAIGRLEAVAAARAKPIDQAHVAPPNDDVFA